MGEGEPRCSYPRQDSQPAAPKELLPATFWTPVHRAMVISVERRPVTGGGIPGVFKNERCTKLTFRVCGSSPSPSRRAKAQLRWFIHGFLPELERSAIHHALYECQLPRFVRWQQQLQSEEHQETWTYITALRDRVVAALTTGLSRPLPLAVVSMTILPYLCLGQSIEADRRDLEVELIRSLPGMFTSVSNAEPVPHSGQSPPLGVAYRRRRTGTRLGNDATGECLACAKSRVSPAARPAGTMLGRSRRDPETRSQSREEHFQRGARSTPFACLPQTGG